MIESATMQPNKTLDIIHAIEEDNMVVIHSHMKQNPNDRGWALIHIFRFNENKIIELWDLGQEVPETTINEYGCF